MGLAHSGVLFPLAVEPFPFLRQIPANQGLSTPEWRTFSYDQILLCMGESQQILGFLRFEEKVRQKRRRPDQTGALCPLRIQLFSRISGSTWHIFYTFELSPRSMKKRFHGELSTIASCITSKLARVKTSCSLLKQNILYRIHSLKQNILYNAFMLRVKRI